MTLGTDTIRGAIKLDNFVEGKCFTSWEDFIKAFPQMMTVEVPKNITNVTLGPTAPSSSDLDNLWVKTDSGGNFVGLYIFSGGAWNQIYPAPQQLIFMYGDSRAVPPGYQLAVDNPNITATQLQDMQKIWSIGGTSPTWFTTFHCVYVGF